MHNHNMLEVNNLSKNFAGTGRETEFAAVDGISFTLDAGECLGRPRHSPASSVKLMPSTAANSVSRPVPAKFLLKLFTSSML